jgi:hypothetical protein
MMKKITLKATVRAGDQIYVDAAVTINADELRAALGMEVSPCANFKALDQEPIKNSEGGEGGFDLVDRPIFTTQNGTKVRLLGWTADDTGFFKSMKIMWDDARGRHGRTLYLRDATGEAEHALAKAMLELCDYVWRPLSSPPPCPMRVLLLIPTIYDPAFNGADYGIVIGYYHGKDHPEPWVEQGTNHSVFAEWLAPHFPTHWCAVPMPKTTEGDKS